MAFKMTNPLKNKYKYVNYGDEVLIDSTPEGNEPRLSDEELKENKYAASLQKIRDKEAYRKYLLEQRTKSEQADSTGGVIPLGNVDMI